MRGLPGVHHVGGGGLSSARPGLILIPCPSSCFMLLPRMAPSLSIEIPSAGRAYRVVMSEASVRVTRTTTTAGIVCIVHRRHTTLADALADLLLTLITEGDAIIEPLCAKAAALQAGWKYGKPGFPAGSGFLRQQAEEKTAAFEQAVMEYGRAIQATLMEAEALGLELPAWRPAPAWLEVALEEVDAERLVVADFG